MILLAVKPLSVMLLSCFIFSFLCIYSQTYSAKLPDDELAVKAFYSGNNGRIVLNKNFNKHKFFLKDYGNYIELGRLEKVLNTRYTRGSNYQLNLDKNNFGYKVELLHDHNKNTYTVIIYGNKMCKDLKMTFYDKQGKEYDEMSLIK